MAFTSASGMPRTYKFRFEGEIIAGEFRVLRSMLPFGLGFGEPEAGSLRERMSFDQGWFDVSYKLEIRPESDLTANPE